jgi:hypothetical protein
VIKCGQQGLADKIGKAHSTVLAKRIKDRVRSEKERGWALCVKGGISVGGFPQKVQDTYLWWGFSFSPGI